MVEVYFILDKKVLLPADKLNDMAASGRTKHFVPLADGGVHLTLHVTTSVPASTSMLQQLTANLRGAPVHQVSILVVVSSVQYGTTPESDYTTTTTTTAPTRALGGVNCVR
ncbi:hypothetical protein H257_19133 [Aphanomyces astaci]|uniref:Uncharacterized protein n=1 Tax=Aphanomyces astaci TaxID=112090 RepID=W4FAT2_APHAT|nr:hypothetical protein H257_19133 [Aphanomyces astaci]ETV63931.1 hypothetical protein H257_19133 [Aphanomyces astaci]|eukprot:XP_009846583.1 hypothetical protein H257_19133 [Aphanomyces astaci]